MQLTRKMKNSWLDVLHTLAWQFKFVLHGSKRLSSQKVRGLFRALMRILEELDYELDSREKKFDKLNKKK